MAINPNEDTEFNDALRKHGILPPREPTPPSPEPPASPTFDDLLDDFTPAELAELGEDAKDDEVERTIDAVRRQRVKEEREEERKGRFGRVYPIGREEYTREVTDASAVDEDGEEEGTGVVCFLYKDGIPRSDRTFVHIRTLAAKHPRTKFVSIVGDKCIPNLPDARVPMIIVYRKGEIRTQLVAWGADRERSVEELEALLILAGAIIPPERPPPSSERDAEDSDDDDDFDAPVRSRDASSRMRSAVTGTNGKSRKNIQRGGDEDDDGDDSDFDFDL